MTTYKHIDTVCPYCGTGCIIDFTVDTDANRIIEATGSPDGVNNDGRLCLKGLYGWDYLNDPQILTKRLRKPLIRRRGKKSPLEEVSWDEAIRFTAEFLNKTTMDLCIEMDLTERVIVAVADAQAPGTSQHYTVTHIGEPPRVT